MAKTLTVEAVQKTIKVIQTSTSKTIIEGAILRLQSYGFSKEQIVRVLQTKQNKIIKA